MVAKPVPADHRPEGAGTPPDGFTQVKNRKRSRASGTSKDKKDTETRETQSRNAFEVLGDTAKDGTPNEKEEVVQPTKDINAPDGMETQQMEIVEEAEDEEMELGELDLDAIEAECGKKGKGYMPRRQIDLLQEEIIKAEAHLNLGIDLDPQTGHKRKPPEEDQW